MILSFEFLISDFFIFVSVVCVGWDIDVVDGVGINVDIINFDFDDVFGDIIVFVVIKIRFNISIVI